MEGCDRGAPSVMHRLTSSLAWVSLEGRYGGMAGDGGRGRRVEGDRPPPGEGGGGGLRPVPPAVQRPPAHPAPHLCYCGRGQDRWEYTQSVRLSPSFGSSGGLRAGLRKPELNVAGTTLFRYNSADSDLFALSLEQVATKKSENISTKLNQI